MWKRTKNRIGEKFVTNKGYKVEIIDYTPYLNCTIKFEDGTILKNITYQNLQKGEVRYPNQPTICNIGYIGMGNYTSSLNGRDTKVYITWVHMLKRCYDEKQQQLYPSYIDCNVDVIWHNFQNFAKWYEDNYIEGYHLDKDILVKGNRIYGPDTCCFVPREINTLFPIKRENIQVRKNRNNKYRYRAVLGTSKGVKSLGTYNSFDEASAVYCRAKQNYIKYIAEKYRDKISSRVYNALINYKVTIN